MLHNFIIAYVSTQCSTGTTMYFRYNFFTYHFPLSALYFMHVYFILFAQFLLTLALTFFSIKLFELDCALPTIPITTTWRTFTVGTYFRHMIMHYISYRTYPYSVTSNPITDYDFLQVFNGLLVWLVLVLHADISKIMKRFISIYVCKLLSNILVYITVCMRVLLQNFI